MHALEITTGPVRWSRKSGCWLDSIRIVQIEKLIACSSVEPNRVGTVKVKADLTPLCCFLIASGKNVFSIPGAVGFQYAHEDPPPTPISFRSLLFGSFPGLVHPHCTCAAGIPTNHGSLRSPGSAVPGSSVRNTQ